MKIKELSPEEFETFAAECPYTTFYQGRNFTDMKIKEGLDAFYLGGYENGELQAASIILCEPMAGKWKYCIAVKGFLLDYGNPEIVKGFTEGVKAFLRKENGLFLRINPAFYLQQHDSEGEVVPGGFDHHDWVNTLISCGFHHEGYTRGLDMSQHVRWIYVIPLENESEASLKKQMSKLTQRNLKTVEKCHVKVQEITCVEELSIFYELMQTTSQRRNFSIFDEAYYRDQFDAFYPDGKIKFLYAQFYVKEYLDDLLNQKEKLEEKIAAAKARLMQDSQNEKKQKKLALSEQELQQLEKRIKEAKAIYEEKGDAFPISAGNFMIDTHEVTYFHGGSDADYMHFCGQFALQWYMMRYALTQGIPRYNMNGISGIFDATAPDAGVYQFKKSFGGHVEEYPGYFSMPLRTLQYQLFRIGSKMKRILKKENSR